MFTNHICRIYMNKPDLALKKPTVFDMPWTQIKTNSLGHNADDIRSNSEKLRRLAFTQTQSKTTCY